MSHHIHPLENCIARILVKGTDLQPLPSGIGVALHGKRVLTCAHVVNTSLKLPRESKNKPEEIVALDFPLSGSSERVTARVGFWDGETDLAELIIIDAMPSEVIPTSMHTPDELWDHRVQAFGFPSKNLDGTWADCYLRAHNARGWVEVFDTNTTGNFIKQGFSGGPVWDSKLECVIGIIVAVERNDEARVGYLIPAHKILEKWRELPISQQRTKSTQKKEIPDLLPYLVNRLKQEDDLFNLYKNNDRQNPLPMIVVVHGDDMQAQDMFSLRMKEQFIPRLLKINTRQTSIMQISLPWPTHIENMDDLGAELTKSLGEEVVEEAISETETCCEDIQRMFATYNSPVVIEMELLTRDWVEQGEGILEGILAFWNNWPSLAPRQNLMVFIYIIHKIPNTSQNRHLKYMRCKREMITHLKHLKKSKFKNFGKIRGTVLSELKNISETEVRYWARTAAREHFTREHFNGEITTLIAKINKLFENEETIAMEPLAFHLKEILSSSLGD